jgi:integrase
MPADTANVRPDTLDGYRSLSDVTPLTLRHTSTYRRLQVGVSVDAVAERQRLTDVQLPGYFFVALAATATE